MPSCGFKKLNGNQVERASIEAATIAKTNSRSLGRQNLHRIENKGGHIEKNGRPKPKCQHHVLDRIFYVVKDDELRGPTKFPNIDYFFMKE